MHDTGVSIAGWGVICAAGAGSPALLAALRDNRTALAPSPRFAGPRFQSNIVGAAPIEPDLDDPAHQLASHALKEARTAAAAVLAGVASTRTGLVLSTTKANIEALERILDDRPCSEAARRHLQADLLAADLATEFDAGGPVQNISNACVSGMVAITQGANLIRREAADAVLVVGVDHLSGFVISGFSALKAIDPEGCRPFDVDRRGLSPGEAGAAVVLVRSDLAPQTRVRIQGWGSSNDANHMTGPSRDGSGLAQAIRTALNRAELGPQQIDYINAHGTGTPYNDAMESAALRTVFGTGIPPVSGIKGMLGHTLGAAGVVETIACILALEHQFLPGTPRLQQSPEDFPASLIKSPQTAAGLRRVLKLNTGFGGINGALLLCHE